MGLLSRLGRAAGAGIGEAADQWKWHAPISNAAIGAVPGAIGGAGMDQENPLRGALTGAAIGAGAMGGVGLGGVVRSGMRGAADAMSEPQRIASAIRDLARRSGPGAAEAEVQQLRMQDPTLADEVMQILMQSAPR